MRLSDDAAVTLFDYMSALCKKEHLAIWTVGWCSFVHWRYGEDARLLELQAAAQGRWIDVPPGQGDSNPLGEDARFQFFDECCFCQQRRNDHGPEEKCLLNSTQYQGYEGVCPPAMSIPIIPTDS